VELTLNDVSSGYGKQIVLRDLNLIVRSGEIVALIGANGAGKSTLVKTISGLLPVSRGKIHLDGERIDTLPVRARLDRGLVHVPEGREVFPEMTVLENLRMGAMTRRSRGEGASLMTEIERLSRRFPVLTQRLGDLASNLSGGQQQALAIARGLMSRPAIMMLDEPSLGLSPALVKETFQLVRELRDEGISVLLSEQNAFQSLAIADRGYVIENGKVVAEGSGEELLASSDIAERYLGIASSHADSLLDSSIDGIAAALQQALNMSSSART
jgi:branched-chain amino acid transport system ATP-binding protein